jgi:hypothetical protein
VFHALGDPYSQASVLIHIGENLSAGQDEIAAREAWQEALVILEELRHPDAGLVQEKLRSGVAGQAVRP